MNDPPAVWVTRVDWTSVVERATPLTSWKANWCGHLLTDRASHELGMMIMTDMEAQHETLTGLLDAEYLRTEFGDQHFLAKQVARRFWPNLVREQRGEGERRVATVLRELQDAGTIYRIGSRFRVVVAASPSFTGTGRQ
jgi:hypothetical protein